MKAWRGSRGMTPLFYNLDIRWVWVVRFTLRPLYPGQVTPLPPAEQKIFSLTAEPCTVSQTHYIPVKQQCEITGSVAGGSRLQAHTAVLLGVRDYRHTQQCCWAFEITGTHSSVAGGSRLQAHTAVLLGVRDYRHIQQCCWGFEITGIYSSVAGGSRFLRRRLTSGHRRCEVS